MSFRPLIFLGGSCAIAFALALFTLASGAGFMAAFLVYSFGGSATLVGFSLLSFLKFENQAGQFAGPDGTAAGWANRA